MVDHDTGAELDAPREIAGVAPRRGRSRLSRRVWTTTDAPRRASPRASAATCTFWPPASTPPRTASGLACSETRAMCMIDDLREQGVPIGQEPLQAVALQRVRPGGGARGAGGLRIAQERLGRL